MPMDMHPTLYTTSTLVIESRVPEWYKIADMDRELTFDVGEGLNEYEIPTGVLEFVSDINIGPITCDDVDPNEQQDADTDDDTFQVWVKPHRERIHCIIYPPDVNFRILIPIVAG